MAAIYLQRLNYYLHWKQFNSTMATLEKEFERFSSPTSECKNKSSLLFRSLKK